MVSRYRYFARPYTFSTYSQEAQECGACGNVASGFQGPFYGDDDIEFLCEPCLGAGALADSGGFTNETDPEPLRAALAAAHPEASGEGVADMVEERLTELCEMTPPLVTWSEFPWPVHCQDFCRFEQEIGREDLADLATDGDVAGFFRDHLNTDLSADLPIDELLESVRPGRLRDNLTHHPSGTYLFRCVQCDKAMLVVDLE